MKIRTILIATASVLALPVLADSAYPLHERDAKYSWQWKSEFTEEQPTRINQQATQTEQARERKTDKSRVQGLVDDANDLGW